MAEKDHTVNAPVRLLLIDDEQGFVNVLAKRIGKRHIEVRKAYSGFEAIQILREEKFDVALLDLKMEDMDYLIKPCDFGVLIDKIQQAVSRRR